jgi:hypothetical protein
VSAVATVERDWPGGQVHVFGACEGPAAQDSRPCEAADADTAHVVYHAAAERIGLRFHRCAACGLSSSEVLA